MLNEEKVPSLFHLIRSEVRPRLIRLRSVHRVRPIVLGHDFAGQMEAMFADDRKSGTAIDLKEWADRPLVDRVDQWSARLMEGLL
jgi:hypothetical protein